MHQISNAKTTRALMALFFLQPIALGGWFAQIPAVQGHLGLSNAQLAIALLALPASFVLVSKFAAAFVARHGAPRVFKLVFPIQAATAILPLIAKGQITLLLTLLVFGATVACLAVALNVYAGQLEKAAKSSVMNRCHGFWALGLMVGSLLITAQSMIFVPMAALLLQSSLAAALGVWLATALPLIARHQAETARTSRRRLRNYPTALLLVALFVFSVTMSEGTMNNWAAVYMADRLPTGSALAGLAVTVYSGFLALGRFLGDALKTRLGGASLARLTVSLAILGILMLVAPLPDLFAFVGFALVGLGVSVGFPLAVSAAAALDDAHEADNIALLSIVAVSGSVIAPPIIGLLADGFGMNAALSALLPGLLVSYVMARHLSTTPEIGAHATS